jgi:hypothetical protein
MFIGRDGEADMPLRARLSAYGLTADGVTGVVAKRETQLDARASFDRCLVVSAPEGLSITSAVLEYSTFSDTSAHEKRWIDDLALAPAEGAPMSTTETSLTTGLPPQSAIEQPGQNGAGGWRWQVPLMVFGAMLMLGSFVAWHWQKDRRTLAGIDDPPLMHPGIDPFWRRPPRG